MKWYNVHPSVCPGMGPNSDVANSLLQVCCCGPDGQEISINCCSSGGRMRAVPLCQHTYVVEHRAVAVAESLNGGPFHSHLRDIFAPQVVRYIDLMESSIAQSIHNGFEKETWKPQG